MFAGCWVLAAQTGDSVSVLNEGAHAIQTKQFGTGLRILEEGTKRYPANAEIWNLLGIVDAELNRTREAESAFRHGMRLAPDSVSLNENIGLLFYRQSDFVGTKRYLARAVELGSKQPGVLFSLAASQLRTGEQAKARTNLETIEPALKDVPGYWEERGRAELLLNGDKADVYFQQALKLDPNSVTALNGAATAAERQGLDEKALAYVVQARAVDPDNLDTLVHFGAICIRRDLGPDAISALEKAHKMNPQSASILFLLARAHISVQDWQQAYDLFAEYSKRVPNDASAFYAMGWIDIQLGRPDAAHRELEHCLAMQPGLTDARYELAQLELNEGQFKTAQKLLEAVLKQKPNHAKAQMAMGEVLLRQGDLDGAQAHLEEALEQDGRSAPAHYKLSTVLRRKHETEKAERERTLATQLEAEAKQASRTQLKLVLPEAEAGH